MIRDSVKPDVTMFVHYETRKVDGKDIVAVTVQKGTNRPYYLGSKVSSQVGYIFATVRLQILRLIPQSEI